MGQMPAVSRNIHNLWEIFAGHEVLGGEKNAPLSASLLHFTPKVLTERLTSIGQLLSGLTSE